MDYALFLRCGQGPSTFSQVLASSRPKTAMISAGSRAKPHVFFRNNSCPPISQPSNVFCGASKVLRSPKLGRDALVSPVQTLAHWRFSQGKVDGKKATRITRSVPSTLGASFALACGLGIFCLAPMLVLSPRKAKGAFFPLLSSGGPPQQPQMGPEQIQPKTARFVLNKFMKEVLTSSTPAPGKPYTEAKKTALKNMKEGKISPDLILKQMTSEVKAFICGNNPGDLEKSEAYLSLLEVMTLLEKDKDPQPFVDDDADILYKEKFGEVLNSLKDLKCTDLLIIFYEAIGYTHINKIHEARAAWQRFIDEGFKE